MNNRILENARAYLGPNVKLYPSTRKGKKWMIQTPDGKTVHFGAFGYEDFTQHKDKERQRLYLLRSGKIQGKWRDDKYSPNMLSREILWR
jgi:2-phospho-L-lactate transferase/gluconeogenesis factor (CofD/UPF0052 family)